MNFDGPLPVLGAAPAPPPSGGLPPAPAGPSAPLTFTACLQQIQPEAAASALPFTPGLQAATPPAAAPGGGEMRPGDIATADRDLLALLGMLDATAQSQAPAAAPLVELPEPPGTAELPAETATAALPPVPLLAVLPPLDPAPVAPSLPRVPGTQANEAVAAAGFEPRAEPTAQSAAPVAPGNDPGAIASTAFAEFASLAAASSPAPDIAAASAPSASIAALAAAAPAPRGYAVETLPLLPMKPGPEASFAERFGEQVVWQVGQGLQEARIQLHPLELGAVDVALSLQGEQASLVFSAEQPQARAALQAALPQLGNLLADQGLRLADAQVQSQQRGPQQAPHPSRSGGEDATREEQPVAGLRRRVGLIDQYA